MLLKHVAAQNVFLSSTVAPGNLPARNITENPIFSSIYYFSSCFYNPDNIHHAKSQYRESRGNLVRPTVIPRGGALAQHASNRARKAHIVAFKAFVLGGNGHTNSTCIIKGRVGWGVTLNATRAENQSSPLPQTSRDFQECVIESMRARV